MTYATGTATVAESVTLHDACMNLTIALRQIKQGDAASTATSTGRFTAAQIDAYVAAVTAAITAANA